MVFLAVSFALCSVSYGLLCYLVLFPVLFVCQMQIFIPALSASNCFGSKCCRCHYECDLTRYCRVLVLLKVFVLLSWVCDVRLVIL